MKNIGLFICLLLVTACATKSGDSYKGLGRESISTAEIEKYAPSKLSSELENKIRSMLDISAPGMGVLHPSNKQIFFSWKVSGVHQIWTVRQGQEFPIQLTGGKDSNHIETVTSDGKWLVINQDKDGQENPGLYLLSPDGMTRITVFAQDKVRASLAFVEDDAKSLVYSANDEKNDMYTFYRYDIATGKRTKVFAEPGQWFLVDHTHDGRWLMVKLVTNTAREYSEFTPSTGLLRTVLGQGEQEDFQVSYAKNEKDLLVITPKFSDYRRLYLLKGTQWKELFAVPGADVLGLSMGRQRQRLQVETLEKGYRKIYAFDPVTYKSIKVPQFKNVDHMFFGDTSKDGSTTMIATMSAQSPQKNYSYNWKTGKLKQWVYPSTPGIDLNKFVRAKLEYYQAKDGTNIPMFVRRPEKCAKELCPVLVYFHGGPEGMSLPGFNATAQLYVDAGFIYVEPNVRGSDGYGKAWLHADDKEKRLNVITDIQDCGEYIKKNWKVNGQSPNVGVFGGSYGGYSTLMAMTKFAGTYNAGVSSVGMSNLVTFLQNTAPYRRANRMTEYGDLEKDRAALVALSPITYIENVNSPLMIIQGANDPRVPVGEALQMQKTLESKKIPSRLIIFADEGHGAEKKDNQVLQIGHTFEFFNKYLK